ncbi:MAG: septation protein [Devosia sp.]|nr:septation protein [Devosia sp.]
MTTTPDKSDEISWRELQPQIIKLGLELGPLIVFFIANARADIFTATAWFMGAMAASLILSWLILKRIAIMPLVTGIVVAIFGTLTLVLQDDTFIKMKPTIVNSLFGVVLLGGLLFRKPLLSYVFGDVYRLQERGWFLLTLRWGLFFIFLAVLNEVVWRGAEVWTASPDAATDLWVSFKVWATMPMTIVFTLFQLPLLSRYALVDPKPEPTVAPTA